MNKVFNNGFHFKFGLCFHGCDARFLCVILYLYAIDCSQYQRYLIPIEAVRKK